MSAPNPTPPAQAMTAEEFVDHIYSLSWSWDVTRDELAVDVRARDTLLLAAARQTWEAERAQAIKLADRCPNCGCEERDHRGVLTCQCPAPATAIAARKTAERIFHSGSLSFDVITIGQVEELAGHYLSIADERAALLRRIAEAIKLHEDGKRDSALTVLRGWE